MRKIKFFLTVAFVFLFVVAGVFIQKAAEGETKDTGAALCKDCHTDQYDSYLKSKHSKKGFKGSPANNSDCIACHKAGLAHVEAGGGKGAGGIVSLNSKRTSAETKSAVCLSCHTSSQKLALWDMGAHKKNDVACSSCHSIHGKKVSQVETCTTCHKSVKKDINRPSHHPIVEGKVKCSDCHNPHGTLSKGMIVAESVNQLCFKCHADKRGPWVWEHPPVEENCMTCHWPHGTKAEKLLTEKMPHLCNDCHYRGGHQSSVGGNRGFNAFSANGSAVSPSARVMARSCTNCHGAIHGSNAPADPARNELGRFLIR